MLLRADAFPPLADDLAVVLAAGVRAVVQPGGPVRHVEAAKAAGITMTLTGTGHLAH